MVEPQASAQTAGMRNLDGEIHVYCLNLARFPDGLLRNCWSLLDEEERVRASRIRHGVTQSHFVMVRSGLRVLLGRYLACAAGAIRFALGEKGKPRLAGTEPGQGLVFNVSHSGDCGLIALAHDTDLGVDVEKHRAMANLDGIAERCFSPGEFAHWRALPLEHRQGAFFALWSFKESFVKATGEGITLGLETCVVNLTGRPRLVSIPDGCGRPEDWRLDKIGAGADYSAGLCYRGSQRELAVFNEAVLVNTLFNLPILA
jgi:4'-phosphopantetheinyl transferase